jgi:penicillin-binding protein 1A
MQLVGSDRSLDRKLREAFTALWLGLRLSKDEILTRYLNSVYLGAGAYGMPAAARIYFDKSLSELTLSESAMLAGLIQAPSRYDPIRNLDAAQRRATAVLDAMVETGAINSNLAAAAKAEPATNVSPDMARAGSRFADWIANSELPKIAGDAKRTVRVRTTLEPEVQCVAEQIVTDALSRPRDARGATEAALIAMRPNGSVVAMVGGRNYDESQFNRAANAQRQPGSTFKLFVYYAALRNGYSPDSIVDASPVTIGRWRPENYDGQQHGRMSLSQAFAQSVNTAAARLAMTIVAARELGLDAPLKEVPSMALGTNEVSLLDLTGAFASIRAGRTKLKPWGMAAFASDAGGLRSLALPRLLKRNFLSKSN